MSAVTGFGPIERDNAHILILGSAPSVESLRQQQYYAHPRNSFWPIMITILTGTEQPMDYPERADLLVQHRIALWDVMMHCERPGSLDSAISEASIETNPFHSFFKSHPKIRAILFNGSKAETTYRKRVLPTLPPRYTQLKMVRLPSTSPAMASLNRQQKLEQWRMALGRYGNTDSIHSG